MSGAGGTGRPRGRPKGSKDQSRRQGSDKRKKRRTDDREEEAQPKTLKKGATTKLRANAKHKSFTHRMLPGSNQRLPAAAHELVEKALLDHDLAEAPADDARWVELYDELRRLVERDSNTSEASTLRDGDNQTADNDDEDDYRWAPSSSSCSDDDVEPTASASAAIDRDPRLKPVLPNHPLSQAVHGYISEALTNKRGALPKDVDADSWSPASLAALSMVVEEVARSQAKFHAQRTMFAKSPRNQVLAARRRGQKEA